MKSFLILSLFLVLFGACKTTQKKRFNIGDDFNMEEFQEVKALSGKKAFHDGVKARIIGNLEEAKKQLKGAIRDDKENHAARFELAKVYLADENMQSAEEWSREAAEGAVDNPWYWQFYAELLTLKGDYKNAVEAYKKVVAHPDFLEVNFDLSSVYLEMGALDKALDVLRKIEDKLGITEEVSSRKYQIYLSQNKIDKAIGVLRDLIIAFPKEARFYGMLAEIYESEGDDQKVLNLYEELIHADPDNPYALLILVDHYRKKDETKNYRENLIKAFSNRELNIDVKVAYLIDYLPRLSNLEMKNEALMLCRLTVKSHPLEAKAYAMYGDFLSQVDSVHRAAEQYKLALELDQSIFTVWRQLLFIQADLGAFDSLSHYSEKAMELFPNQALLYLLKGIASIRLKSYTDAIRILNRGVLLVSENPMLLSEMYANLGDAYHELMDHPASDSSYDESLKLNPNNAFVLNNYSYYLSLRGEQLEKARQMSAKANDLMPDTPSFQDTYGWVLFKLGEYQEALQWLEKSLQNSPSPDPEVLEHYGDCLLKLGREKEAIDMWNKALDKGGSPSLKEKIRSIQSHD